MATNESHPYTARFAIALDAYAATIRPGPAIASKAGISGTTNAALLARPEA